MLKEILLESGRRPRVLDDCVALIDEQVASKSGLSGIAVKGVYAVVKAIKPGFIREASDHLLDDFVARLEPFYAEWKSSGGATSVEAYMREHAARIADALLGVTDAKAERARNMTLKKSYAKLRPTAAKHVEAAVPGVGRIIAKHAKAAA